jgi:hypothetical protein
VLAHDSGLPTENCQQRTVRKKMSGRWGDRPLGRGDGGYSNPKSVQFFRPFCCAREQQNDAQEQGGNYSRKPKPLPTTCLVCFGLHSPSMARRVHSFQYFPPPPMSLFWYGSTPVLEEPLFQRLRITFSRCSIDSRSLTRSSPERVESACASDSTRRRRPS